MAEKVNVFKELSIIDVKDKVKKKEAGKNKKPLTYLPWSSAVSILAKFCEDKGLEWSSENLTDDVTGRDYFDCGSAGAYVKVSVTVNGTTRTASLPIMDGTNRAMKSEPYEYVTQFGKGTVAAYTTTDINRAHQRCLAKAIALHGLGIYIYEGEEAPDVEETPSAEIKKAPTTKAGLPAPEKKPSKEEKPVPPQVDAAELPGGKKEETKAPVTDDLGILRGIVVPEEIESFGGKTLGSIADENVESLRNVAALIADKTLRNNIVKLYNGIVTMTA